ncbi:MAG: Mur ligase domain-containing protein, partial [Elusimicrobiaceae bacterium]
MLLSEIIKTSDVEPPAQDIEITALSLDSRQVKPGCLFFAVKGAKSDGHGFIETAVKNGAVAVAGTE